MSKKEFLMYLRKRLSGLPKKEIEERVTFYGEMIDDRMEEGLSEEEAVSAIGNIDELIAQMTADVPIRTQGNSGKIPNRSSKRVNWVLLLIGSPVWLSLLIAAFAVLFSVGVSVCAVFCSLAGCGIGLTAGGIVLLCRGTALTGIASMGSGFLCAGLSIFVFIGCKAVLKGIVLLAKKMAVWVRNCFVNQGVA